VLSEEAPEATVPEVKTTAPLTFKNNQQESNSQGRCYIFCGDRNVSAAAPVIDDKCGRWNDSYTIPNTPHVRYWAGFIPLAPGSHPTLGLLNITITATADLGYTLTGQSSWQLTFTNASCDVPVEAQPPAKYDPCGTSNDTYSIPYAENVKYYVGDSLKTPGSYSTNGANTVTITAHAKQGYVLTGQTSWTFEYTNEPCLIEVTPTPPTQVEVCGPENDTVIIPEQDGVIYWQGEGVLTVYAAPEKGFVFPAETQTYWEFTDQNTPCPVEVVEPVAPTVVCGPNNDVVTLPEVEHITYTQTGWLNGQNTVTATADEGYYFPGEVEVDSRNEINMSQKTTMSWTFTDENTSCPEVLGATDTPATPAAVLHDTGTNVILVSILSAGVISLAMLTQFNPNRLQKVALSVRAGFAQPFTTI